MQESIGALEVFVNGIFYQQYEELSV